MIITPNPQGTKVGNPRAVEFLGATQGASNAVTLPAGIRDGDVGVLWSRSITTPSNTTPSGWTLAATGTAASVYRMSSWYKRLVATDSGVSTAGLSGSATQVFFYWFRPYGGCQAVTIQGVTSQITTSNPTLQSMNLSAESNPCIVIGLANAAGSGSPVVTGTLATDGINVGLPTHARYAISQFGFSGLTYTWDMGNDGASANGLQSFYLRVT